MKRLLHALVRFYQLFFSAWINAGCRYTPSCSHYALRALERHGAAAGSYLTAARLVRCHPWCDGGFDPVPDRAPSLFRRFVEDDAAAVSPLSDKTSP